jgi:hypothetical protein
MIYTFIFLGIMFYSLSENCNAEENPANISIIGEPTYKLKNTFEKNGRILGKTFQIDIIFSNTGDLKSDEIEVNLTDEEGYVLSQRTYFELGETKTISFTWSTINIRNQILKVSFYPSDLDTLWNKYNSGYKIFTIKVNENNIPATSTPGFEILLTIIAIISFTYLMKKKG